MLCIGYTVTVTTLRIAGKKHIVTDNIFIRAPQVGRIFMVVVFREYTVKKFY